MKLTLGTAQLGLAYGVSNTRGQVPESEVNHILKTALAHSINALDTARSYGTSEAVIGKSTWRTQFRITTKTASFNSGEALEASIDKSLVTLDVPCVDTLLIHNCKEFFADPLGVAKTLTKLKHGGKTRRVGISIYDPENAHEIFRTFTPDVLQFPLNVVDQRTIPLLNICNTKGVDVQVRSVFLQGALLMNTDALPRALGDSRAKIRRFHDDCRTLGISPLTGALQFIKKFPTISSVVVGCCSAEELKEIVTAFNAPVPSLDYARYVAANGYNPSFWGR